MNKRVMLRNEMTEIQEMICDKYCHYPKTADSDEALEEMCMVCEIERRFEKLLDMTESGYCPWQE